MDRRCVLGRQSAREGGTSGPVQPGDQHPGDDPARTEADPERDDRRGIGRARSLLVEWRRTMRGSVTSRRNAYALAAVAIVVALFPAAGARSATVIPPRGPYYHVIDLGEVSLAGQAGAPGDV